MCSTPTFIYLFNTWKCACSQENDSWAHRLLSRILKERCLTLLMWTGPVSLQRERERDQGLSWHIFCNSSFTCYSLANLPKRLSKTTNCCAPKYTINGANIIKAGNRDEWTRLQWPGTISNKYQQFPNIVGILPGDRASDGAGLGYFSALQTRKRGFLVWTGRTWMSLSQWTRL